MNINPIPQSTLLAATEVVMTAADCRQGSGPTQMAQVLRVVEIAESETRLLAFENGDFVKSAYEFHQRRGKAADQARALIRERDSLVDSERGDFAFSEEEAIEAMGRQALEGLGILQRLKPAEAANRLERVLAALEKAPKLASKPSGKGVAKRSEASMTGLRNAAILLLKVLHRIGSRRLKDRCWKGWEAPPRKLAKVGGVQAPPPVRADRLKFRNAAVECLRWIEREIGVPGTAEFDQRCATESAIFLRERSPSVFHRPNWEGADLPPVRGLRFEVFRGTVALLTSYLVGTRRSGAVDLLCCDVLAPGEKDVHGHVGPCIVLRPGKTAFWRKKSDVDGRKRPSVKVIPAEAYFAIYAPYLEYLKCVLGAKPGTALFCTRAGAPLSDGAMARVLTEAGRIPGHDTVIPTSHQGRHAAGRHAGYLARIGDLEGVPIEYPAEISIVDMTEYLLDHEIKADQLGYLGMRDMSVREISSRELIKLAWLSLSDWGLPRKPDIDLFDDAIRRQLAVAASIAEVEAAIEFEESGESTRKVVERERKRRIDLQTAQKNTDDLVGKITLAQLAGCATQSEIVELRSRFDSACSERLSAYARHAKAEEEMLAALRDSRERVSARRVELRQLDAELLRAEADEALARSWPRYAVRDEHATSYDLAATPNWDAIAEGIRGNAMESIVYVAVREFVTIAEIAAYLGKDPDTIVSWARDARGGKAKGPFSAASSVLDAELGKKNRRIWVDDLAIEWIAAHETWLTQITAHWPLTWPAKYRFDEYAWRVNP